MVVWWRVVTHKASSKAYCQLRVRDVRRGVVLHLEGQGDLVIKQGKNAIRLPKT